MLRVVEGRSFRAVADRIVMLETNLDDLSGEVIGYTIERLREAGAVGVFVTPAYGKKNRPVQVLHVITAPAEYERLLAILMEESGTLGVRVLDQPRLVAERNRETRLVTVGGRAFEVQVKTSIVDGRVIAVKAEYDDLRRIARELGRSLRSVDDEVRGRARCVAGAVRGHAARPSFVAAGRIGPRLMTGIPGRPGIPSAPGWTGIRSPQGLRRSEKPPGNPAESSSPVTTITCRRAFA